MIKELRECKPGLIAGRIEPGVKLLAQRDVERPVDEVVGFFHADLPACLGKVSLAGEAAAVPFSSLAATPPSPHSSISGDHPPHVSERPPMAKISPA